MLNSAVGREAGKHRTVIDTALDRQEIDELLQNWVLWRDSGDWERFATVWHTNGRMNATWFKASAAEFIEGCRKGFEAGIIGLHSLGGTSIEVQGSRAIAHSRMQIVQRGAIDGIEVDVTCIGRFVDALEKREGKWGLVLRQPVYEHDRMDPVDPTKVPVLNQTQLQSFPVGYRHLAYLQAKVGFDVFNNLPGTRGPEIKLLNEQMRLWLAGANSDCFES